MITSAQVRSQLIQALTLDLVGPTPDILAQLEQDGRTAEAAELREELLDRPPNRWYQTGFLIPSETSLGDRAPAATASPQQQATATELLQEASKQARRIERGIEALENQQVRQRVVRADPRAHGRAAEIASSHGLQHSA